jgi:IS4 transposase
MMLKSMLARFSERSPVTVMAQVGLERALGSEWLDDLFDEFRERQYTRELLFSSTVELMSMVALGLQPSVHAAAQAKSDLRVSLAALYSKINGIEPGLSRALVACSSERLEPIAQEIRSDQVSLVPGYQVRIVDGNHHPASEKRLAALRGLRGAALPGHTLVVYDPDTRLVVDVVPCEDGHAQERTLVPAVIGTVKKGQLWIADRNFSTKAIMADIHRAGGAFLIREHGASPNPTELGVARRKEQTDSGEIYEQTVEIALEDGARIALRRIEVRLNTPTEDGETVIRLLTNLPRELAANVVASAYRHRWKIENMFQWLESVLHSEVRTLGYPRATLFAFSVAALAYNVLSIVQSTIEVAHDIQPEEPEQLSLYYVANEIKTTYEGMMIAVPEQAWEDCRSVPPKQAARFLLDAAVHVNLAKYRKHPRGPKKLVKKGYVAGRIARSHVATARVLDSAKSPRKSP